MAVPFTKFTTRKWAVLTNKIDKLFIGIGINFDLFLIFDPVIFISQKMN
jgi:hypothetical protein